MLLFLACKKDGSSDEPQPRVSINDVSMAEGNAGVTVFGFEITLSRAYPGTVTVNYSTTEGLAKAGED